MRLVIGDGKFERGSSSVQNRNCEQDRYQNQKCKHNPTKCLAKVKAPAPAPGAERRRNLTTVGEARHELEICHALGLCDFQKRQYRKRNTLRLKYLNFVGSSTIASVGKRSLMFNPHRKAGRPYVKYGELGGRGVTHDFQQGRSRTGTASRNGSYWKYAEKDEEWSVLLGKKFVAHRRATTLEVRLDNDDVQKQRLLDALIAFGDDRHHRPPVRTGPVRWA
ncbi:hypothetical protein EVAR_65858_1 [Eumeta japonica]|uniref:Uncharacterized protein n=1 Tax=Eumeta variegata TaxID=151549 RepID=A0A4C1ZMP5_EUMVA|nr:hypothetical protein EVAR_65858_1 [Eumeta japonica]